MSSIPGVIGEKVSPRSQNLVQDSHSLPPYLRALFEPVYSRVLQLKFRISHIPSYHPADQQDWEARWIDEWCQAEDVLQEVIAELKGLNEATLPEKQGEMSVSDLQRLRGYQQRLFEEVSSCEAALSRTVIIE